MRLGKRALTGVVVDIAATSDITQEKSAADPRSERAIPPLSNDLLRLADFVAGYYQEPLGLVLAQMVPPVGQRVGARSSLAPAAPLAQRLTEEGRAVLASSLGRAPRARELFERFHAAERSG